MKLINFTKLVREWGAVSAPISTILNQTGFPKDVIIDTDDFSRRTMSQCLTEDYCKGWNDCYEDIMKKLETTKGETTDLGAPVKIIDNEFELQGYIVREKYYHCPNCELTLGTLRYDDLLTLASENKFCKKCGEKLNWGNLITQTIK